MSPPAERGGDERIDPQAPQASPRLNRKSVLALALAAGGVVLVLFFSSQSGGGGTAAPPPPEPFAYDVNAPLVDEITPPPVAQFPVANPWQTSPAAPENWAEPNKGVTGEEHEERRKAYTAARQSPGVIFRHAIPAESQGQPDSRGGPDDEIDALLRDALAPLEALGSGLGGVDRGPQPPAAPGWQRTTTGVPVGRGAYVLRQGSVIDAALETAMNSDRPGPVIARVVRPVRDSRFLQQVLIPAGTKLIGAMEPTPAGFRDAIVVAWTRIQFSDGGVLELPGFPAIETTGGQGVAESVDRHRMGRFGAAAFLALMGTATTYTTAQAANSTGSLAGAALGIELARMGNAPAQSRTRRRPTVKLRPGYRFFIYVSDDVYLPPR